MFWEQTSTCLALVFVSGERICPFSMCVMKLRLVYRFVDVEKGGGFGYVMRIESSHRPQRRGTGVVAFVRSFLVSNWEV